MPFDATTTVLTLTCEALSADEASMDSGLYCYVCKRAAPSGAVAGDKCTYVSLVDPPSLCIGYWTGSSNG
jgi:hypothetical protein